MMGDELDRGMEIRRMSPSKLRWGSGGRCVRRGKREEEERRRAKE